MVFDILYFFVRDLVFFLASTDGMKKSEKADSSEGGEESEEEAEGDVECEEEGELEGELEGEVEGEVEGAGGGDMVKRTKKKKITEVLVAK